MTQVTWRSYMTFNTELYMIFTWFSTWSLTWLLSSFDFINILGINELGASISFGCGFRCTFGSGFGYGLDIAYMLFNMAYDGL